MTRNLFTDDGLRWGLYQLDPAKNVPCDNVGETYDKGDEVLECVEEDNPLGDPTWQSVDDGNGEADDADAGETLPVTDNELDVAVGGGVVAEESEDPGKPASSGRGPVARPKAQPAKSADTPASGGSMVSGTKEVVTDGYVNDGDTAAGKFQKIGAKDRFAKGTDVPTSAGTTVTAGDSPEAIQQRLLVDSQRNVELTPSSSMQLLQTVSGEQVTGGKIQSSTTKLETVCDFDGQQVRVKPGQESSVTPEMKEELAQYNPQFRSFAEKVREESSDDRMVAYMEWVESHPKVDDQLRILQTGEGLDRFADPAAYAGQAVAKMDTAGVTITAEEKEQYKTPRATVQAYLGELCSSGKITPQEQWSLAYHAKDSDLPTLYEFCRRKLEKPGSGAGTPSQTIEDVLGKTGDAAVIQSADDVKAGIDTVSGEDARQIRELEEAATTDYTAADAAYEQRLEEVGLKDHPQISSYTPERITDLVTGTKKGPERDTIFLGRQRELDKQIDEKKAKGEDVEALQTEYDRIEDELGDQGFDHRSAAIDERTEEHEAWKSELADALSRGQNGRAERLINGRSRALGMDMPHQDVKVTPGAGRTLKKEHSLYARGKEFVKEGKGIIDGALGLYNTFKGLKTAPKTRTPSATATATQKRLDGLRERRDGKDGASGGAEGKGNRHANYSGEVSAFAKSILFPEEGQKSYKERHKELNDQTVAGRDAAETTAIAQADKAEGDAGVSNAEAWMKEVEARKKDMKC